MFKLKFNFGKSPNIDIITGRRTDDEKKVSRKVWTQQDGVARKVVIYLFNCIVLYCIVLYCIVLYCIVLYYIVLYCIVLHLNSSFVSPKRRILYFLYLLR